MKCPSCGTELFANAGCAKCAKLARPADATQTVAPENRPRSHRPYSEGRDGALTPEFVPDARVANRYVIHSLVGHGGMGSVYRAHDLELDRTVALKTIRDEMSADESAIARFKKEIVLSAQVTHKNVCRVFDLGQHEDTRFLTMEFIEGQTLGQRIRGGEAFTFEQIAEMMWQTAQALQAAHEAGVVHRDLKPDNIMLDASGKIAVMDFGIARRVGEIATMGFSGTPRYSAPEQIRGDAQDRRSDLYSFGLIFYEVLTGTHPFPEASSLQAFRDRAALPVARLVDRRADIPAALNEIVLRCLAADPEQRYASAGELAHALDSWLNPEAAKPLYARPAFASAMAAALVLSIGGTIWFGRTPPPAPKPVSLLIADFDNLTGEQVFTGTMEPALQVALEGASFITTYDRGAARRVAARLRSASTVLDQEAAVLVAVREGIGAVVNGAIRSQGGRYTLTLRTMDPATGKSLLKDQSLSVGRDEVLAAVGRLSIPIRTVLGDTTPENEQVTAAETFTASSIEAAHAYAKAQDLQLAGRYDEAANAYEEAIRLDAGLGRAYAGLAVLHRNFNHPAEALKNYEMALARLDRMSERERLRTRGGYYVTTNDNEKAVEEYTTLVRNFPADTAGHANLALALLFLRKTAGALEEGRKAIQIYPKNVVHRNNVALYAMYSGNYDLALQEAELVIRENAAYEKPHIAIALASLARNQPQATLESYEKLSHLSVRGASMALSGLADLAIFQGRLDDAVDLLRRGIAADEGRQAPDDAARKYATLAQAFVKLNRLAEAQSAAARAAGSTASPGTLMDAAFVYIDAGAPLKAEAIAAKFRARVGPENQVSAGLIDGYSQLRTSPVQAIATLRKAQQPLDTWLGRYFLGRAYLAAKAYPEAHSELEACIKRAGEALAVYLDDIPTARLLPPALYYFAQAQDGMHVPAAPQAYQTFLSTQTATRNQDPLVATARARLARNVAIR